LFSILGDRTSEKKYVIALFDREKQADHILFGYGGDRLCKGSTTGGAISLYQDTKTRRILFSLWL
jgi:hypothetical protein